MLVTAAAAVACALFVAGRNVYFAERRQARSVLADVKGIANIDLRTFIDVTEEINSITLKLDGQPESIIKLDGLGDYENSGQFYVGRIGKWTFKVFGRPEIGSHLEANGKPVPFKYFGGHIAFGPNSPYTERISFEVNTLQDLVDHYEDFVELLETWPRESEPGTVTLQDGTTQYFYVVEDQLPPK